jgi:hypothetical protein
MADNLADVANLEARMADVRENLRVLVEQAAAYSGGGNEELMSDRIAEQEEELDRLTAARDALARGRP